MLSVKYLMSISYIYIKYYVVVVILLFLSDVVLSQSLVHGENTVISYEKGNFNQGTQNWGCFSLENGSTYFANNSGMIEFSGANWETYTLPNKTIVRSICPDDHGRIYAGGQDEIGYFEADKFGQLTYHSIRDLVPQHLLPLEDVWRTIHRNEKVYFLSINKIFIFDGKSNFSVIDRGNPVIYLGKINGEVFFQDLYDGIYMVDNSDNYQLLEWSTAFKYIPVVEVLRDNNGDFIILTEFAGAFRYNGELNEFNDEIQSFLKKNRIHTGAILKDQTLAVATQFGGAVVISDDQVIVEHYNKVNGLQNNNILSLNEDFSNNLWIGTSNGVDKVLRNDRIKMVKPDGDNEGAIYDIIRYKDNLYFGTNNGLYYFDVTKKYDAINIPQYKQVAFTNGQVWGLDTLDDKLLIGHNEGALMLRNNEVIKISEDPGAWRFINAGINHMYVGTYTGIHIYEKSDLGWSFLKVLPGFNESSRIIAKNKPNELWVSHPYRGVYRLTHDDAFENVKVTLYDDDNGLPSLLLNYVFSINNEIVVTGKKGIFLYDSIKDSFVVHDDLASHIDTSENTRRLFEYDNDIYYISESEVGCLKPNQDGTYEKQVYPELIGTFIGGFENLVKLDSSTLAACTDRGAKSYSLADKNNELSCTVRFTSVQVVADNNKILYDGHGIMEQNHQVYKPEESAFLFEYVSSDHSKYSMYRYKLDDIEDEWSQWSPAMSKEYNNLKSGDYTFMVQAMNQEKRISKIETFSFKIKAPWYETTLAYLIYILLVVIGILSLYLLPNRKYQKEKEELTQANVESESEIDRLKNEQLEKEIDHKNRELASSTLHLVQKNETINKLRTEIEQIRKKVTDQGTKKELKKVLSVLMDDDRLEQDWESFSSHFDQVHSDFLKRLKAKYPQISPKDLKMAAYLRLNLSTKEIAPLLNISIRGVEISRYRLRKKLGLDTTVNLSEYMMEF